MFETVFYSQSVRRGPLYFPMAFSLLVHAAALVLLVTNPEWVITTRIFISLRAKVAAAPMPEIEIMTWVFNEEYAAAARQPQARVVSDRDRTAASVPKDLKAPDTKTAYSEGDSPLPLEIGQSSVKSRKTSRPSPSNSTAKAAGAGSETRSLIGKGLGANAEPGGAGERPDLAQLQRPARVPTESPKPSPPKIAGNEKPGSGSEEKEVVLDFTATGSRPKTSSATPSGSSGAFQNPDTSTQSTGSSIAFDAKGFQNSDAYAQEVNRRLQKNLVVPSNLKQLKALHSTVYFHIERDGRISNVRLITRSGDNNFDFMTLNTVYHSNPFPPLPPEFSDDHIGVRYSFYKQ